MIDLATINTKREILLVIDRTFIRFGHSAAIGPYPKPTVTDLVIGVGCLFQCSSSIGMD
jgi:hypothetical protein